MQYLLLICSDKSAPPPQPADLQPIVQGHMRVSKEISEAGKMVASERLRPDTEGVRVRMKAGQRQIVDGPFTETKEAIGGFYLIDARDLNDAIRVAAKLPSPRMGMIEVRPMHERDETRSQ